MLPDKTVPVDVPMPQTTQTVMIVVMSLMAAASFAYALRTSRRRGDIALVALVLGAAAAIYYEPLGDMLVKVYYTERGQATWIHAFGRDIPAFIGILYLWYLPAFTYFVFSRADRGIPASLWWKAWGTNLALAIGLEIAVTNIGGDTWIYHGTQAFKVLGVPLGTPFTYVSFCVGVAGGVAGLTRVLPRRQQWLIAPAIPFLMVASHAGTSLPLAVALYGSTDVNVVAIGALGTVVLALILSHGLSLAFREPWAPRDAVPGAGAAASTGATAAAPRVPAAAG